MWTSPQFQFILLFPDIVIGIFTVEVFSNLCWQIHVIMSNMLNYVIVAFFGFLLSLGGP